MKTLNIDFKNKFAVEQGYKNWIELYSQGMWNDRLFVEIKKMYRQLEEKWIIENEINANKMYGK